MKILINGIGGRMGGKVIAAAESAENANVICGVDKFASPEKFIVPVYKAFEEVKEKADVVIDFSIKDALTDVLAYAIKTQTPVVLCTTGYDENDIKSIENAAKSVAIFRSANMSYGVNVVSKLITLATELFGNIADIEITETHHNQKKDAPSGTAKMLFDAAKSARPALTPIYGREGMIGKRTPDEVGIHALRGGTVVGKHEVSFFLNNEVITIKHEAESRDVFASGAIKAADFLASVKAPGLYDMNDVLAAK